MNIFARELVFVLGNHGKELGNLFGLRVRNAYSGVEQQIPPTKVTRLKRSLSEDITATLNADELEALQDWAPLDEGGEELRRLRAALVAEAVRHLLTGRMDGEAASQLGEVTLELLLARDSGQLVSLRDQLLSIARGVRDGTSAERLIVRGVTNAAGDTAAVKDLAAEGQSANAAQVQRALDGAMEAYEHGALWLEVARETAERGARLGYVALAASLLGRAESLASAPATIAQGTPEQAELLALIVAALEETAAIR